MGRLYRRAPPGAIFASAEGEGSRSSNLGGSHCRGRGRVVGNRLAGALCPGNRLLVQHIVVVVGGWRSGRFRDEGFGLRGVGLCRTASISTTAVSLHSAGVQMFGAHGEDVRDAERLQTGEDCERCIEFIMRPWGGGWEGVSLNRYAPVGMWSAWLCGFGAGYTVIARGRLRVSIAQGSLRGSDVSLSARSGRS